MIKRIEICGTCIFFKREYDSSKTGQCRRNPPVVFYAGYEPESLFPEIGISDWCGEYKADEKIIEAIKKAQSKSN